MLQCLRWYLRYPISYCNLEEMMIERGIEVDHTTLYRWVQAYSVELAKRIRYYSKPYSTSWRVDETYIKVKGKWKYLYRVVDKYGSTIDFMLSSHRNIAAAKKFFKQAMITSALKPKIITTDKHSSYNKAIIQLKDQKILPNLLLHRQCKYLNNVIESDHRRIKRRINPMLGFKTFNTARRYIFGIEAMAMMIKKQTHYLIRLSILEQVQFVKRLFYIYD
ncbi:MAG: IS6 family transposase [Rickettsiaceae bacterium]|nr:IS6 family transposase [Rickettsiaceae bacterium]